MTLLSRARFTNGTRPCSCSERRRAAVRGASFAELQDREMSEQSRLNVAIVAPSMGILGGQAVQASRLLRAWRDDPDVHAWLVPINPLPPRGLQWTVEIKYLR